MFDRRSTARQKGTKKESEHGRGSTPEMETEARLVHRRRVQRPSHLAKPVDGICVDRPYRGSGAHPSIGPWMLNLSKSDERVGLGSEQAMRKAPATALEGEARRKRINCGTRKKNETKKVLRQEARSPDCLRSEREFACQLTLRIPHLEYGPGATSVVRLNQRLAVVQGGGRTTWPNEEWGKLATTTPNRKQAKPL